MTLTASPREKGRIGEYVPVPIGELFADRLAILGDDGRPLVDIPSPWNFPVDGLLLCTRQPVEKGMVVRLAEDPVANIIENHIFGVNLGDESLLESGCLVEPVWCRRTSIKSIDAVGPCPPSASHNMTRSWASIHVRLIGVELMSSVTS